MLHLDLNNNLESQIDKIHEIKNIDNNIHPKYKQK